MNSTETANALTRAKRKIEGILQQTLINLDNVDIEPIEKYSKHGEALHKLYSDIQKLKQALS